MNQDKVAKNMVDAKLPPIDFCVTSEQARRGWVRFITPDLIIRLSWETSATPVTQLVSLVELSHETATVLLDVEPPSDQAFALNLESGGVRTGAIRSRLIDKKIMNTGRTLAHLRFESLVPPAELSHFLRERRAWKRVVPQEKRAVLSWRDGASDQIIRGEMRDISGGGAAVCVSAQPPADKPIWLSLGAEGREAGPVECRPGSLKLDSNGNFIIHLAFVDLCPLRLYEVAMGLAK